MRSSRVEKSQNQNAKFPGGLNRRFELTEGVGALEDRLIEAARHRQPLSHVRLLATLWAIAHQPPLSMGFFRRE